MTADREQQLKDLYAEGHAWASRDDPELVPRRFVERSLDAEVVLIGQALAQDTQRLSGLPYTFRDGSSSGGGRQLSEFLEQLGHSIDPSSNLAYAHSIDLVPRFPGRKQAGAGDIKPSKREIEFCARWLRREIEIVSPKAVVLLGALPTRSFLERCAGVRIAKLEDVAGQAVPASVGSLRVTAFPVYHPSGAWQFPAQAPQAFAAAADGIRRVLS
jgi:uracil-DNA glycosylase family 4